MLRMNSRACKAGALPAELHAPCNCMILKMILIEFRENDYLPSKQVLSQSRAASPASATFVRSDTHSDFLNGSNFDSRSIQSKNALTRWVEHSVRNRRVPQSEG